MGLWHWLYHSWWVSHCAPDTTAPCCTWLLERKTSRLLSRARKIICASRASEAWPFSATLMPYSKPQILRCPWPSLRPIKIGRSGRYGWVAPTFPQPFWVGYSCPWGINESKVPFKDVDSLEPSSKFIPPTARPDGRVSFCWPSKGLAPAAQFHQNIPVHKLPKNHKHPMKCTRAIWHLEKQLMFLENSWLFYRHAFKSTKNSPRFTKCMFSAANNDAVLRMFSSSNVFGQRCHCMAP